MSEGSVSDRGPAARRELVRRRVLASGYARVEDLVREFDVSLMTMHRDLDALEADGWINKTRGAATANPSALIDSGVRERMSSMQAEKAAMCAVAAELLRRGQTIFLDDSTTVLGLVPFTSEHMPLTVATNFLPAIHAFGEAPAAELHLLGGEFHPRQESCQGLQTVDAIDRIQADLFFMSTTAIMEGRCLHRSEATVLVRRAFMRNATRKILLVDHAKFGRSAPHALCDVSAFDTIVTDDGIDVADLRLLRERCHDVRVAPATR